jgi:hypothetical protein
MQCSSKYFGIEEREQGIYRRNKGFGRIIFSKIKKDQ